MAKKTTTKENPETNINQESAAMENFSSMCGESYDPKPKASCNRMCKAENPDAFESCVAHYLLTMGKTKIIKDDGNVKVAPVKERKEDRRKGDRRSEERRSPDAPATKKKERKQKVFDMFGDGVSSTASQINSLLICGASMEEILSEIGTDQFTGTNKNRVRAHFHSLKVADMARRVRGPQEIFLSKETGRYYLDDPTLEYYGEMSEEGCLPIQPSVKPEAKSPAKKTAKKAEAKPAKKSSKKAAQPSA